MTNEEKALNLSRKYSAPKNKNREIAVYQSAIEMANWKDQQFEEYLERKIKTINSTDYESCWELLNEIINELFNEK